MMDAPVLWPKARTASLASVLLAFVLALGAGCASGGRKPAHGTASDPDPYLRISRADSNVVTLEIALRQFRPARGRGPAVWLSAATHIG